MLWCLRIDYETFAVRKACVNKFAMAFRLTCVVAKGCSGGVYCVTVTQKCVWVCVYECVRAHCNSILPCEMHFHCTDYRQHHFAGALVQVQRFSHVCTLYMLMHDHHRLSCYSVLFFREEESHAIKRTHTMASLRYYFATASPT